MMSVITPPGITPPGITPPGVTPSGTEPVAPRAGAELRAARERLGWTLTEVAANLRIRQTHLEALEQGRLSALPGNAYALAYVRSYARALGLDPDETARRFKAEAAEVAAPTQLVFPAPVPERGLPAGAMILLGLMLTVGVYAGWYRLSADGTLPAEAVAPIPERLAPLAEQAIPPVPSPPPGMAARHDETGGETKLAAAESAPQVSANPPLPTPMAISPTSAAAAPVQKTEPPVTQLSSEASAPDEASAAPAPDESGIGGRPNGRPDGRPDGHPDGHIVLRANALSWLMVKDKSGTVLLNRTLKAGETWVVPPRDDLLLTTGNAGGTDILVDGSSTPSLGIQGTVRRDLPLDPEQIKGGKLAISSATPVAAVKPHL